MLQGLGESQGGVSGKGLSQALVQLHGLGEEEGDLARARKVYARLGPAGLRHQRWRPVSALGGAMEPRPAVGCATTEGPADQVRLGERRYWIGEELEWPHCVPRSKHRPPDPRACRQSECGRTESGGTAESGRTGGPVASGFQRGDRA